MDEVFDMWAFCPDCGNGKSQGHEIDCKLKRIWHGAQRAESPLETARKALEAIREWDDVGTKVWNWADEALAQIGAGQVQQTEKQRLENIRVELRKFFPYVQYETHEAAAEALAQIGAGQK